MSAMVWPMGFIFSGSHYRMVKRCGEKSLWPTEKTVCMKRNRTIRSAERLLLGMAILFALTGKIRAEETGRGGYAGAFLRIGLGARAQGMGGGTVAGVVDATTAYYNPAGLVYLDGRHLTTALQAMSLDRRLYFAGYAQSFGGGQSEMPRAGFSVSWLCAGIDDIDARDFNGNPAGQLSSWEHAFYFSFALNPVAPLALGFNAKLLVNRFPDIIEEGGNLSAVGFGFDIGLLLRPASWCSIGLSLQDLRSRYTWDTQDLWERGTQTVDRFPLVARGGGELRLMSDAVVIAFDLEKVEHMPLALYTGTQVVVAKQFFLRGGLRRGGLTLGIGSRLMWDKHKIQVDYAYVPDAIAPGGNHVFSWAFGF
jgi:hypothetical protein